MKALMSTAAARAWIGVVVIGVVIVALVIGLGLLPRLGAGQELIDAAKPVMSDPAVRGEVAATKALSQYVDLLHPLMTRRGRASTEVAELETMISRRTGVSTRRARALLRREAPNFEALLRALPLSGVVSERPQLRRFLATSLNVSSEEAQDEFARGFPRLFQTLSELPAVTSGWYDVPGIEGMTRFGGRDVRSARALRNYVRDDLVGTVAQEKDRFQAVAGSGGIGYIPVLLLIAGVGAIAFGLLQALRSAGRAPASAGRPPGRIAWGVVVAAGVLIMLLVGALQYFPRLSAAETLTAELEPAFDERRVAGLRAGTDLLAQSVRFGDPIATRAGGAVREYPEFVAFIGERAGLSSRRVRGRLADAAPRTAALLQALPLSAIAREVPHLRAVLVRKLDLRGGRLGGELERRTPAIAQIMLTVRPVTESWNSIDGTEGLERFDGVTPVRSLPEFADHLDRDVVAVFEDQRRNFAALADRWPPLGVLAWLLLGIGAVVAIYGAVMMFLVAQPAARP